MYGKIATIRHGANHANLKDTAPQFHTGQHRSGNDKSFPQTPEFSLKRKSSKTSLVNQLTAVKNDAMGA